MRLFEQKFSISLCVITRYFLQVFETQNFTSKDSINYVCCGQYFWHKVTLEDIVQ